MARLIDGRTGQDVYAQVLEVVRRSGVRRPSRNGTTYALDDVTIHLESPRRALPLGTGRMLNPRIAAAEALQLIGGFTDPSWLMTIAPGRFDAYAEPDGRFWGAYGNRIDTQFYYAAGKLRTDPWTRQAVITLWHPGWDNQPGKLDYPCTVAIGFSFSDHDQRLNMRVTMRSNDAWLGLPYDMFQFGQLQLTLCNVLNVEPGFYKHTAWSLHLYEQHYAATFDVTDHPDVSGDFQPQGLGRPGVDDETGIAARAWSIRVGHELDEPTESELWYVNLLKDYA